MWGPSYHARAAGVGVCVAAVSEHPFETGVGPTAHTKAAVTAKKALCELPNLVWGMSCIAAFV